MLDDGTYYSETFGIEKQELEDCEPGKTHLGGMSPELEFMKMKDTGFVNTLISFDWIVRQNELDANVIKTLQAFLPLSSSCFKYFDITAKK